MMDTNVGRERKNVKEVLGSWIQKIKDTKIMIKLPVYEIEKAENRYEAMAARGWRLVKRGERLEYYRKDQPEELQYRMEYCPVKAFDGVQDLTDDQVDFYEECGWSLVCERRGEYVFFWTPGK